MSASTPTRRRPFHGSCHCGSIKYIIFLTLPHKPPTTSTPPPTDNSHSHQEFYRCNCTACHKASHFHIRTARAPSDFMLLTPVDPLSELGDYTCNSGLIHWFFCKKCGGRCFLFAGKGETADVDLDEMGVGVGVDVPVKDIPKKTIWRPKAEGWGERRGRGCYLSVNGYTIDPGQDGFELGEFTTNKCVAYLDCLGLDGLEEREPRYDKPYKGGAF